MISLATFSFWINFNYFLLAIFVSFYIPGSLLLRKLKLNNFDFFILSLIVGIVLWIWQGFILGVLNLRQFTYIYLIIFIFLWIKKFNKFDIKLISFKNLCLSDIIISFTVLLGTSYLLLTTFLNGILTEKGLYFCCGLPDNLYHLALTNQLTNSFPPIEPGASDIKVSNYHYLGNLMVADFVRIFHLPLIHTTYQYFTFFFSVLFGLTAITFSRVLRLKKSYIFWLLLFIYFSGDVLYLLMYQLGNGINFNFPFLHHSGWLWISPSRVYSSVILLGGLSLLLLWIKKRSLYLSILLALLFSSLVGIKIYTGIFAILGFMSLSTYYIFKRKSSFLILPALTIFLSMIIHFYTNHSAGGLTFTGIWRFENFISSPQLNLSDWELKRQTYIFHKNTIRIIQFSLMYLGLYFIFIFGTLNLAFIQTKKTFNLLPKQLHFFLIPAIFFSLIIGSLFIQDTGGANSSQFLITAMIFMSIYAALSAVYLTENISKNLAFLFVIIILLLTIPRSIHFAASQYNFQKVGGGHYVTRDELEALTFLKKHSPKDSVILADNLNKNNWRNAYSHYISFLSDRQLFLDGEGITRDHGVNVEQKLKDQKDIFESSDSAKVQKLLYKNNISFIYLASKDNLVASDSAKFLNIFFENESIKILNLGD